MSLIFYIQTPASAEADPSPTPQPRKPPSPEIDDKSLSIVKNLLEAIKDDGSNDSFRRMIQDNIMNEHTLSHHGSNQPYFYSDNRDVITDIINRVLEEPEGMIDETATAGFLKIYREFDYHEEIENFFKREKRAPRKFQDDYLGQTITGPTNKVMVTLKIKGDEQTGATLEKRLTYGQNNIQYLNAYPVTGTPAQPPSTKESPEKDKTEEPE